MLLNFQLAMTKQARDLRQIRRENRRTYLTFQCDVIHRHNGVSRGLTSDEGGVVGGEAPEANLYVV